MPEKTAKANVTPVRQRSQYTCMSTSFMMCLQALGYDVTEDEVNSVLGARPLKGASWEQLLAAAQHFGCRATLTMPSTIKQLKGWTDQGIPVMIAWNPEGRDWSHASVVFHVDDDENVHVADPNIPDPDETVRIVPRGEFYGKWSEKWPNYLVRRPACAIEREITSQGKQVMARKKKPLVATPTNPVEQVAWDAGFQGYSLERLLAAVADALGVDIVAAYRRGEKAKNQEENAKRMQDKKRPGPYLVLVGKPGIWKIVQFDLSAPSRRINEYAWGKIQRVTKKETLTGKTFNVEFYEPGNRIAVNWNAKRYTVTDFTEVDPFRGKRAGYKGNPDGEDIYPHEVDHGYGEPLSGGTDVMRRLQNRLIHEQGNVIPQRPESPRLAQQGEASMNAMKELRHLARFPRGESVDVPKYLRDHDNPDAADAWEEMNEEHGDKFKSAAALGALQRLAGEEGPEEGGEDKKDALAALKRLAGEEDAILSRFEEGKPADPTQNMNEADKKKWRAENERNRDKFKSADWAPGERENHPVTGPQAPKQEEDESASKIPDGEGNMAKRAAGGLYGFSKVIQADVERANRKVEKAAQDILKGALKRNAKVADFLRTHADRGGSTPAQVLVGALSGMTVVASEPDSEPETKEASYSLYGYRSKVAKLGLQACSDLRMEVGRIASDLHRRKAEKHAQILGFLEQHGREANCVYSRIMHASYPAADARIASHLDPSSWITWED